METNILKSTTVDTRNLSAKSLDSDKIILEGQDVLETIENGTPQIKDFVNRVDISEDEYYVIWDDTGQPVEWKTKDGMCPVRYNTGLKTVDWKLKNDIQYAFQGCINLETVEDGLSDVTQLYNSFLNCHKLKEITISNNQKINQMGWAFYNCYNLKSFNCEGDNNIAHSSGAFENCYNLETFNMNIAKVAYATAMFKYCKKLNLSNINFPSLIEGDNMFFGCLSLKNITVNMPKATYLSNCFNKCENLSSVTINAPLTTIGPLLFCECKNLVSVSGDLSSLTEGTYLCISCHSLETFDVPSLNNLKYAGAAFENTKLTSFDIDMPSLTTGDSMFRHCKKLTSFTANIENLESSNYMFDDCTSLRTFTSKLTKLKSSAFMFNDAVLDKTSIIHIFNTIKNDNITETDNNTLWLGFDNTLRNDEELQSFLSTAGTVVVNNYQIAIKNKVGKTWNMYFVWNTPPAT